MNKKEEPQSQLIGNYEDKYHSTNLISKYLVTNFIKTLESYLGIISPLHLTRICEIGCGEGEILKLVHKVFPDAEIHAVDISQEIIEKAKVNCKGISINFSVQNAENLRCFPDAFFDLVICTEVLEHLSDPQKGMEELFRISQNFVLVSVPNEPIWRILNLMRGRYFRSLGDTPGHLNHWNIFQFPRILRNAAHFKLLSRGYPFPWQIILMTNKNVEI